MYDTSGINYCIPKCDLKILVFGKRISTHKLGMSLGSQRIIYIYIWDLAISYFRCVFFFRLKKEHVILRLCQTETLEFCKTVTFIHGFCFNNVDK